MITDFTQLNQIDVYLSRIEKGTETYGTAFPKLIQAIAKSVGDEIDGADTAEYIFKPEVSRDTKRFFAVCILRLLSVKKDLLNQNAVFKHKLLKLFDETIPDIYDDLGIKANSETYHKEMELKEYIPRLENRVKTAIQYQADDLSQIKKFKTTFLRAINEDSSKTVFDFFLGNLKSKIENVFHSIEKYVESPYATKHKSYETAIYQLEDLLSEANQIKTRYSLGIIEAPFTQLKELLEKDFKDSPLAQIPELRVIQEEKKYPFRIVDSEFPISIEIEILNDGIALNANLKISRFDSERLHFFETEKYLGDLSKGKAIRSFICKPKIQFNSIDIDVILTWKDYAGSESNRTFTIQLQGQEKDLDWGKLKYQERYSLESVETEEELIGRSDILNDLAGRVTAKRVGSSYIFGQRRVGKTSIVKTLESKLKKQSGRIITIYSEAGDWSAPGDPEQSIENLANRICSSIKSSYAIYQRIEVPSFHGSLANLTIFLDAVIQFTPDVKILIILDEFDRINSDLYQRGEIAKSFFSTLRAISNRNQFGFILVGGEQLEFIITQWVELNKFKRYRVDYFNKSENWNDFKSLVISPVNDIFEFTEYAIETIYNQSSGNPFFTKLICIELYKLMCERRDGYITGTDIKIANAKALTTAGAPMFSHFWEDGIGQTTESIQAVSLSRKKILLAIGECIKFSAPVNLQEICKRASAKGVSEPKCEKTIREFEDRQILEPSKDEFKFKMKFLEDWLLLEGLSRIISTLTDQDRRDEEQILQEESRIKNEEIRDILSKWKLYCGQHISLDQVTIWLSQFGNVAEQRLIFPILKGIKLYTEVEIREAMETIFTLVTREMRKRNIVKNIYEGKIKRGDILVSYLDKSPFKSGAEYGKIFVDQNNIYVNNNCEPDKIGDFLRSNKSIKCLLFLDDFIGTGKTAEEAIMRIEKQCGDVIRERNLLVYIGIVTGFLDAKSRVEEFAEKMKLPLFTLQVLYPLSESDKCFSEESRVYPNPIERSRAESLVHQKGVNLDKKNPLGYGNCQALTVFPHACPNNTLTVLWKETDGWQPLFKRI